ncbi:MAG: FKBP-type peptidyl-prolyl cis-trans isomerase [Armatimonadota bacterium]|nr:FKBP-type peptidyl-prolyl cis-trans isomerase [Armatimonadota bacterium]
MQPGATTAQTSGTVVVDDKPGAVDTTTKTTETVGGTSTTGTPSASKAPKAGGQLPGWPTKAASHSLPGGLQYKDLVVGKGPAVKAGDNISMHYTGYLMDGTKFDSSIDRGQPFPVVIGTGQVIKGWDQGIIGMKVGGKRKLIIPAALGYGAAGTPGGPIPGNADLVFDTQLLQISGSGGPTTAGGTMDAPLSTTP